MATIPKWFQQAVTRGLSRLICLGLDGQPAQDIFADGVVPAWIEALWSARRWAEQDGQAIGDAFVSMSAQVRRWPAPRDLLDLLPQPRALAAPYHAAARRQQAKALPNDAARARVAALLAECARKLDAKEPGNGA